MQLWLLSLSLWTAFSSAQSNHHYTDSFPTYDEYDPSILDPDTVFGSPYGGFSRASRSRLAALPLFLPPIIDSDGPRDDDETTYMQVRDSDGRLFACRVYREDELSKESLKDSMFNVAVLSNEESSSPEASQDSKLEPQHEAAHRVAMEENSPDKDSELEGVDLLKEAYGLMETQKRLSKMKGICAQIHKGWWSYEWCYEESVTQFHVRVEEDAGSRSPGIRIEDVTSLGKHSHRDIAVYLKDKRPNQLAEGLEELSRVEDDFTDGSICESTGKPRETYVTLQCCSERIINRHKSNILLNGRPAESTIATFLSLIEDPDAICHYNATICTPLLCADDGTTPKVGSKRSKRVRKEGESVREILDRVFENMCLQSATGGWWTYEVCHGKKVRQFHEKVEIDKMGMAKRTVETEHILGIYDPSSDNYPNVDEWKHVVNATEGASIGRDHQGSPRAGNGAFFVQEYIHGDTCDHSDVTDAAIKAGNVGEGGVERASSVRFSCGERFYVQVNEDSTCHYIVDVMVPELCHHPLFRAPVSKQQVVKCLPVEPDLHD